jgi:lipopolysaccharide export system protein LptC
MRLPTLSAGLGACALLASVALAQNAGDTGRNAPTLPVGQTFKQFTFPVYAPDGQLRYTLFATEATGITLNRAETTDLRIEVYDNGAKTTTITSPKADLYAAEQKMRTKNTVLIDRTDMRATSQDCDFDVKAKKFLLRTNVKVLLKHFDVGGSKGNADQPAAASGGSAIPTPMPNNLPFTPSPSSGPAPTDESILPSPGSYSDTNAAPLPPAGSMTK